MFSPTFSLEEEVVIWYEVHSLLSKAAIRPADPSFPGQVAHLFMVPKKDRGMGPGINLGPFSGSFLDPPHFGQCGVNPQCAEGGRLHIQSREASSSAFPTPQYLGIVWDTVSRPFSLPPVGRRVTLGQAFLCLLSGGPSCASLMWLLGLVAAAISAVSSSASSLGSFRGS